MSGLGREPEREKEMPMTRAKCITLYFQEKKNLFELTLTGAFHTIISVT